MIIKFAKLLLFLFISSQTFSQNYSSLTLDSQLKESANAVLRIDETKIEIPNIKSYKMYYKRVITILNKNGDKYLGAYVGYDKGITIKKLNAIIYNQFGKEIKKYRKSDFTDVSAVSSFSLYEDSRVKYLDYTPTQYPYTVEFIVETTQKNTAHIPFWRPLEGYFISTISSSYEVVYDATVGINKKERNFLEYDILDKSIDGVLKYEANNIKAIKSEVMSPKFLEFGPKLFVSPQNFYYEGYLGNTKDWKSLGKWMYNELLFGRNELSEQTTQQILSLVKGVNNPIEKAKIVYQYVQDNTRYISVQEGIGGIQPINAIDVDKVKYGDCKGLTNYTKALLDVVGVKSNYTRVYGSKNRQDVNKDFVTFLGQTNHVILNIPNGEENIWLECTSQKVPFGHIANFTDDRDVFVITPEGGKIEHTKAYTTRENYLNSKATIIIDTQGTLNAKIESKSGGVQYDDRLQLIDADTKDRDEYYKNYWDYVNDITINKITINNNKNNIELTEKIDLLAPKYATKIDNKLIVKPNIFNHYSYVPKRYTNRKQPFEIQRGFLDTDEYEIHLPENYIVETLPEDIVIETKFGTYKSSIKKGENSKIIYTRSFEIFKGYYPKEDYKNYRNFIRKIIKADKTSIILKK
jgi:transglutaminase-like putative cysteine protease